MDSKGKPIKEDAIRYMQKKNLCWHHVPGGKKMQAVNKLVHAAFRHVGGAHDLRQIPDDEI
jgi:A nuclease of the HNH/ENDO VII superfamily with conserved WHH